MKSKSMTLKIGAIARVLIVLWLFSAGFVFSQTPTPAASPSPSSLSPDKKWEYKPATNDEGPKIVKAGTSEMALDLSDDCSSVPCAEAIILWAPDSKRFAFNHGVARDHNVSLYLLRDDHWIAMKSTDEVDTILDKAIAAQVTKTMRAKMRVITSGVQLERWIDANTALLFAHESDFWQERDKAAGAKLLVTIKFDDAGNWKIIKTHRMSEKKVEKREKEQ